MLWRALRHVVEGFYIDVGAADPSEHSVTRVFYDRDWHGLNLEPNEDQFTILNKARARDINLPIGAGREAGQLTFYNVGGSGLSTFDPAIAARHQANGWAVRTRIVELLPLAEICRRYRPEGPIHFLKIDVEGAEADVLAGADFDAFRPWVVLVEATLPGSQAPSHDSWERILTKNGYSFVWFDGLNRFYLSSEMKPGLEQHFRIPPNVFDGFVPSVSLLKRAERAEQSLSESQAQVAEERNRTAEVQRHIDAQLAEERNRTAETQRLADQRLRTCLADHASLTQRVRSAEARVSQMLASTSWRVTAPIRTVSRVLRGGSNGAPVGKQLARNIFYRSARVLRRVPGVRWTYHLVGKIAPAPTEWLKLRYIAYDQRDVGGTPSPTSCVSPESPESVAIPVDLSEDEGRLYRQFVLFESSPRAEARKPA